MTSALVSVDAERAILGAALLHGPVVVDRATVDLGLRAEHFALPLHEQAWAGIVALRDEEKGIDALTVADRAKLPVDALDALAGYVPAAGNWADYAALVVEYAMWRERQTAADRARAAITARDEKGFESALSELGRADRTDDSTSTPEQLADDLFEWLADTETADCFPTPWSGFNPPRVGGLRRGDLTLVAAWSSVGKSLVVSQILEHNALAFRTHLYTNEMTRRDWMTRQLARHSSVPFGRVLDKPRHTDADRREMTRALGSLPSVGITDCSGWTGEQIARHIRRHRWDLCAIDLLSRIGGDPRRGRTEQVDAVSRVLNLAAVQAECHVLLVVQLNQERNKTGRPPRPVRRDIRDSGNLANDAANVLFLHREYEEVDVSSDEEAWEMTDRGSLWWDKVRQGAKGGVGVRFDSARMRFDEQSRLGAQAAAAGGGEW